MKGILIGIVVAILVLVIGVTLVAGYFGFVPGVSTVLGANRPRDLGITFSEQARMSAQAKAGWQVFDLPSAVAPVNSLTYSGQQAVKASFTSEELTAWLNPKWKYTPLTDCQVRVNPDNTVEISGILHMDRLSDYAEIMGMSGNTDEVMSRVPKFIMGNPAVYMKASASVTNNNVSGTIYDLKVGRFSVPSGWIKDNMASILNAAESQIRGVPGASVKSLSFSDGKANFDGTLPAVISRKAK